jgi:hypothetical protein
VSIQQRLRKEKDKRGWKPPWHYHFKVVQNGVDFPHDPKLPPIDTENCGAHECDAPGCPRTESGFPA